MDAEVAADEDAGEDFDWGTKSVVVREVMAIAVYENTDGDIVVRQHDWPDEDSVVIIPKRDAKAVIDAIQAFLERPKDPMDGLPKRAGFSEG